MYFYWPFDVFSDIFSTFGFIVGGIIALVLALLIIAFYAVLAIIAVMFIAWLVGLIWQTICRFMVWVLPSGKKAHLWFKKHVQYQQYSGGRREDESRTRFPLCCITCFQQG